ncbi:MAG TPA: flagellar assembly peptidoglycan hydrolase FlgJ [Noviherbaspirillum sp.]|uniref:flagellar assembly peptidoglycan hydrolase FlgJ n=1 Tax=Noviherbaspirillum sp. TaxID=1926288 RepID=UPI002D26E664|nr:flagellar assembly peptidoglycan hydrolase FlgJ [Noviherbaspirillum sp.]HYD95688.1 flagellar assembly peptidoglycan hydrolase FlgJ [Noviherbaspirillum sp.]
MVSPASLNGKLAIDVKDVGELRQAARQNSPEALKGAAKQFEALFMNMMLKSMREATPQDGMFSSDQTRMYTSMLDQQLSQTMASRGLGLADALFRQLSTKLADTAVPGEDGISSILPPSAPAVPMSMPTLQPAPGADSIKPNAAQPAHVRGFVERLASHAEEASRATGIPAKFMLGQAALESGWGRREITARDGTPSHNLFGIKAGAGWKGKVVEAVTTEYVNGQPQTKVEKFRAYDSYADAFKDYARLLSKNPRYENVIANAASAEGFAQGLQRAGYATDPHYAAKLTRIIKQTMSA